MIVKKNCDFFKKIFNKVKTFILFIDLIRHDSYVKITLAAFYLQIIYIWKESKKHVENGTRPHMPASTKPACPNAPSDGNGAVNEPGKVVSPCVPRKLKKPEIKPNPIIDGVLGKFKKELDMLNSIKDSLVIVE